MGKRYGDLWSFSAFGVPYVVVNHPDLVKEVLQTQAEAFWKGPALQNSKGIFGEGLLTAEGDAHKQQRRMMTPAFHAKQVASYAEAVRGMYGHGDAGVGRKTVRRRNAEREYAGGNDAADAVDCGEGAFRDPFGEGNGTGEAEHGDAAGRISARGGAVGKMVVTLAAEINAGIETGPR